MAYKVVHRPDELLQRNNARDYEAEGLADTFIGQQTVPAHQALERFVDERLANRTFETLDELGATLGEWPAFYIDMHGHEPHKVWSKLYIAVDGHLSAKTRGPGGDFVFALYEAADTPVATSR